MEKVKILGIDPSLRNTGLAVVTYDTEKRSFTVEQCQVVVNPAKFTGNDAILNMLDMLSEEAQKPVYQNMTNVIIESPPIMFNKNWSGGTVSLIAHIAGGAAMAFDLHRTHLFKPNEWNKARKKEVTHNNTISILGDPDQWHYLKRVKSEKYMEHILDAVSMALWWIKGNYIHEE